jgi:predicted amidohydrolase YtcJ
LILHNGPIYTMDPRLPRVRALAVAGTLVAGGVDVREGDLDSVGHERIDLDGRCVLPGFTDAHVHFLDWALERRWLDLHGCETLAETLKAVAAAAPGEGWLRGKGWVEASWPDGPPTAAALDTVTGERPAALWAHDHHTLWVNSAALRA